MLSSGASAGGAEAFAVGGGGVSAEPSSSSSVVASPKMMQDLADVTGVETDWFVAPDLEHCEFCKRRWDVQRGALSRAQDLFRGREVKRVPLFADEVQGEEMLRVVAACLD